MTASSAFSKSEVQFYLMQGLTWLSPDKKELIQMLQRWVTAFPRALKCHLTYDSDLRAELEVISVWHNVKRCSTTVLSASNRLGHPRQGHFPRLYRGCFSFLMYTASQEFF